MQPLIGLTCATASTGDDRPPVFQLNQAYVIAVTRAGGVPVIISSLGAGEALRVLYDTLDAILLPGGADLHPSLYGEEPHSTVYGVNPIRDETELALARWALVEEKPILGICRGQQALNVAAGGTLIQDIPTQVPHALPHDLQPRTALAHPIAVEPDSRLADLFGSTQLEVNSLHHQAVAEIAPGFVATARAPDGVIEGIERPDHPFAVSVQFHPEELIPGHEPSERLVRRFVAEAAARAAQRRAILHQIESR
jgi:putative glutamine amidotransferase